MTRPRTHTSLPVVLAAFLVALLATAVSVAATTAATITLAPAAKAATIPGVDVVTLTITRTTTDHTPVPGAVFTARQVLAAPNGVLLNLDTNAGWQAAQALTVEDLTDSGATGVDGVTWGEVFTATSDGDGIAQFTVPVGLYLVEETRTPGGVDPAAAFVVTLPMTNPTGDGWMTHVTVFPKTESVPDAGTEPGRTPPVELPPGDVPPTDDDTTGTGILPGPGDTPGPGAATGSDTPAGGVGQPAPPPSTTAPSPPGWLATTGASISALAILAVALTALGTGLRIRTRNCHRRRTPRNPRPCSIDARHVLAGSS